MKDPVKQDFPQNGSSERNCFLKNKNSTNEKMSAKKK